VTVDAPAKQRRGFAAMSPEKQRELARRGGAAVPKEKRAYATNKELAATSGRKGGRSVAPKNRAFSTNRELAKSAGRKGGSATARNHGETVT